MGELTCVHTTYIYAHTCTHTQWSLINPRLRACAARVIVVGLCVCVCMCPSVCLPFLSVTATTLSVKRGLINK